MENLSFFLLDAENTQNAKWEKLEEPNSSETLARDVASATILDQKNYMSELEHIISKERSYKLELDADIKKMEEDMNRAKGEHNTKVKALTEECKALDEEYNMNYEVTKNLFSMIANEQLIDNELIKRASLLENTI